MTKEHTSEEIKYRLSDLGVQIGNIAIEYITELEEKLEQTKKDLADYQFNYPTIKELEKENAELEAVNKKISDECHKLVDSLEKKQNENVDLLGKIAFTENALNNEKAKVADLEKENAELKRQRNNCEEQFQNKVEEVGIEIEKRLLAEERCKNLEKENAELKKINADGLSELNHINGDLIIENEKLRKENAELKKMYHESDEDNNRLRENIPLLAEAKELLKWWVSHCGNHDLFYAEKTERFLREVKK